MNSWKSRDPLPSTSKTLENKIENYLILEILKLFLKCKINIVLMHNVKTKQTIRIVEWNIHQSQNLSKYTSIVRVKTFEKILILLLGGGEARRGLPEQRVWAEDDIIAEYL